MRPEDLAKMKKNFPKKRKAPLSKGTSKKSSTVVVAWKETLVEWASAVEAAVTVAIDVPSGPPSVVAASISATRMQVSSRSMARALTPLTSSPRDKAQPSPMVGPSGLPPLGDQVDIETRLSSIPEDATFDNWRVDKELIERMILPMELEGIGSMDFDDL